MVSFSSGQRSRLIPRHGVVQLSANQWVALRIAAALIERWGEVTHVFGGLESWHLLRALGRRPLVLTVAVPGRSGDPRLLNKVERFVVETNALANEVVANGVDPRRIEVVYPGIDLNVFRPAPPPASRFRILFASSPADPAEFEARGIPLLIETARRCPDVEFVFLWRRWGSEAAATVALKALQPPANVTLNHVDARDMAAVYNSVHAVACCYAEGFGKSAPNSVIEGLACGRPALVSTACGLADVVKENGAGAVAARNPESLANVAPGSP